MAKIIEVRYMHIDNFGLNGNESNYNYSITKLQPIFNCSVFIEIYFPQWWSLHKRLSIYWREHGITKCTVSNEPTFLVLL